jgi:hypothetical protein
VFQLSNKAVIDVTGKDAFAFLQNILTSDMAHLPSLAALLSPQGKILFQFYCVAENDIFHLIIEKNYAESLMKRLSLYKLRADVALTINETPIAYDFKAGQFKDTRHESLGYYSFGACANTDASPYFTALTRLHIPEIGVDFKENDIFPHEANMDKTNGVSFKKGCYIGQEVVSRMQHKTEIRKRFIGFTSSSLVAPFTPVLNGERQIGVTGSQGLMLVRLDLLEGELTAEGNIIHAEP